MDPLFVAHSCASAKRVVAFNMLAYLWAMVQGANIGEGNYAIDDVVRERSY